MGKIKNASPVKLIISIFTSNEKVFEKVTDDIEFEIGKIELISDKFEFNHTNYYEEEFGKNLFRRFIVIKPLFPRDNIAHIKIKTNNIEEKYTLSGKRMINIDPGYLSLENFILFTTKNYTHRIYLGKGIFADLTLIYQNKEFQTLPWTYPDYSSQEVRQFLKEIRVLYKKQL